MDQIKISKKFDGEGSKISEDPMAKFHKLGGGGEGGPENGPNRNSILVHPGGERGVSKRSNFFEFLIWSASLI